ncbi:MAG: hypothetical protein ACJAUD_001490 [Crocinitomicaceae bacterium]|jgi:hypothetical protein
MKKLLLSLGGCLAIASASFSQTTLFQDDLESGSSQWSLNTGTGANTWVVNNSYLGFAGLIPDTPNQPGAITNSPQSTYMHITNTTVCGGLSVCNANFDTGSATNQNTEIATSVDASTYTNVTVSFWYLSAGQTNVSYGTMEYSLDGGSTWTGTGTDYVNTSAWTQESVSMPGWDNAAAFKIRFKWQNGGGGLDPAFSVDEVLIVGTSGGVANTITTAAIVPTSWCEGEVITTQVNYTSTGTFTAGNIYTAELSDASGSFGAPIAIGTDPSTANSGMVVGVIPGSVPAGTGYRIRVVSDNPVTVGTDNGSDLVVNALPTVTLTPFVDACDNGGVVTLSGGLPAGGSYSGIGVSGGAFNPLVSGSQTITYSVTDGNGCIGTASELITVVPAPSVTLANFADICTFDPFFTMTGGAPAGGTYTGPGVTGGVFDPATAGAGTHTITYSFTDANGCTAEAIGTIFVDICGAIGENNLMNLALYPNPVSESFQLVSDYEIELVQISDMSGRIVKSFGEAQLSYDINTIPSGVYMVTVHTADHIGQLRIVVE